MLWVDHESYFGPDRRRQPIGIRIRERRRYNCACNPPPLSTALRQLRMRVLEAEGARAAAFANRVRGTALLAQMQGETNAANALSALAASATRGSSGDVRPSLYQGLDRAHAAMGNA